MATVGLKWAFGLPLYIAAWLNLAYLIGLGAWQIVGGLAAPDGARMWQGLGSLMLAVPLWAITLAVAEAFGFRGPRPRLRWKRRA
ncbi:hypothetical protein SPF06_19525 [Sinomonas sp. JGH33]|uniref:DUF4281 domain-containing protein n=1 Tax=Sinomonas terricola TaxID=3110330 RepID=A0ABU5TB50_9MICC|nr:hypothetical protein [Sinomonas sp. JGH33]MEA5456919.1 hypothetical protein [Sinomonas sp. JGH33]